MGHSHKNVGLAALDDGVGMRCWEMGVIGGLRGEQMRGLVPSLCSCLDCLCLREENFPNNRQTVKVSAYLKLQEKD
ncbi:hypothetical protein Cni_G13168 [Canna indica]|uniref:Uncharacterized protein n=1 Tax=Canna indica TaxID=4628 RepID=A0AAQ3K936_9LILI|nr:hypothetical protein Cni_G13168 [Canna indica]